MKPAVIKFERSGLFYKCVSGGIIGRTYSYAQIRQDYPENEPGNSWVYTSRADTITLTQLITEKVAKQTVLF
jgi:hypothetical protein